MKRKKGLQRKSPIKRKPRKNDRPEVRAAWFQEHLCCALCGQGTRETGATVELHHLLGGRFGRVDDPRNFLALCGGFGCQGHLLAEGHRVRSPSGSFYPKLTLAMCLYLKRETDVENFDMAYLQTVAGKWILPDPEPLPEALKNLRHTH